MDTIPKPDELLALHDVAADLFGTLRRWFGVPDAVTIDLAAVDSAVAELGDPVLIAAMAMRKLQALHLLATPGVRTTTDVVVTMVQDLQRALIQAPSMRLTRAAAAADWDAELAALEQGATAPAPVADPGGVDPEVERFREGHARVLAAMEAVVRASDGAICYLV